MSRARYGQHEICKHCGQDIEFHGNRQWLDRGANRSCSLVPDDIAGWIKPKRKIKHKPAGVRT